MKCSPTIHGESVRTELHQPVIDPAHDKPFAECPIVSPAQLDRAIDSADRAFKTWRRDEAARREALKACAARLRDRSDELVAILSQEQGKPLKKAAHEVAGSAAWFDAYSRMPIPRDVLRDDATHFVEARRVPLGVVGAITPWNYPLLLAVWKIAPALLAGNTLVVKPSPFTPLTTLRMGELMRSVLPPGVLNVVAGDDTLGAHLTRSPKIRKVSLTGSVATGKKVAAAAADHLARLTLELGGNDAAIVLEDADPAKIAEKIFWGAFENSGQVCVAIKRLYVHEKIYPALLGKLVEIQAGVKVGSGLDPTTQLGPINNRPQFERARGLLDDCRRIGATIHAGPQSLPRSGYFLAPTLVTDIADTARLMAEEQFAPILPIVTFRDEDEALERANASAFGLGGSVWSGDVERATAIASQLDVGTAWVNQVIDLSPTHPFGGHKHSGVGIENGALGLEEFFDVQVLNVARS